MSRTEMGYSNPDESAAPRTPDLPSELWALLETISHQIDEADQRHTGLLQELRDRLAMLSHDAEEARADVPADAVPAFARIEDGLAELAHRIDALDESKAEAPAAAQTQAPVPLISAAGHPADARPAVAAAPAVDPFDLVGDDEPETGPDWDLADAEALTRIYEESDAALVRMTPRSPEPVSRDVLPPASPAAVPDFEGLDRAWLDGRLSEISVRIEQSLADLSPDAAMQRLGSRFDAFEERMGSVLGDVATRTDVESLRDLEERIHELARHLEQTERQLGRLDSIEQQLHAVIDHLAQSHDAAAREADAAALPDLAALAATTAEEVAQRLAASVARPGHDSRLEEVGSLLRSLIDDRRHNDEQTYSMLDTVQQAMIRLLDRVDALEVAQVRPEPARATMPTPPLPPPPPASQTMGVPPAPTHHGEIQDFGVPDPAATDDFPPPLAPAPAATPLLKLERTAQGPTDRLRQDFFAEAQRAKMRAAAAAEAEEGVPAPAAAPAAQRAARGLPRPTPPSSIAPAADLAAAAPSRKQRLTALVLCLVIAVSGAALFSKTRNKAAPAPAPAAVTQTAPEIDVPARSAAAPAAAAPAAPAPAAAATAEGGAFELPADDPAPVPAPVPASPAAAPPSGSGGPATNEDLLGLEGEVPDSGEFLEHRPQTPAARVSPEGIILQDNGRSPTPQELAYLHSQQTNAALSSRLGDNASRLTPADLMPEEVAKHMTPIAATAGETLQAAPVRASLSAGDPAGRGSDAPVTMPFGKTVSPLTLPPATVGPLSLRLAAANGDPSAAFEVGARLAEGKGTDQNFKEAMVWYQKSAAQGFAQAQYRLGTLYERGLGVKADTGRARMWYQRAAEQGNVKAMHNLAVLSAGRDTGSPDYATAARWFESAADYGLADSQYNLAVLYENGLGVGKDLASAYKWYALAGRSGDREALRRRTALKAQMTPDMLTRAEQDVAMFSPERQIPLANDARVAGEDWKKRQDQNG